LSERFRLSAVRRLSRHCSRRQQERCGEPPRKTEDHQVWVGGGENYTI
jgi:hypothetical protein